MPQSDGAPAQAQGKAQEVAGQAQEKAQQAAGQAKHQVRTQVRTQVDQRSTQAGEQVNQQASDIRTVAEQLREQGKDGPAKVAEQAADRIQRVGSYLERSDADRILDDIESFARQRPMAVMAGGLALGLVASRFLKASQGDRYRSRYAGDQRFTRETPATPPVTPTGYSIPSSGGTGLSATPDENELSTGVRPQTPATAPVTGGM